MDVCSIRGLLIPKKSPSRYVQLGISMFKRPRVHTYLLIAKGVNHANKNYNEDKIVNDY